MTYRLALIGKNISHSKSKAMYEKILGESLDYHLLDCSRPSEIPSAQKLLRDYDGVSITAPYKRHFRNEVEQSVEAMRTEAINCLYRGDDGGPTGANTDYIALTQLVPKLLKQHSLCKVILLGDGAMAKVISGILMDDGETFEHLSRKENGDLTHIDLDCDCRPVLIINCCSRAYVFDGNIDSNSIFWDLNYSHPHRESLSSRCLYIDGEELLFEQAKVALGYWGISTP